MDEQLKTYFENGIEAAGHPRGIVNNIICEIFEYEDGGKTYYGYNLDCKDYNVFNQHPVLPVIDQLIDDYIDNLNSEG